jgi:type II secretory pathway pseudopilin PulG
MIEMIGVLAIIAILAVIVVPKVFSTIASSRVTSTVASINAVRSSLTEFCGRFGTIPITGNNSRIDDLLVTANLLDNRFVVKIGTQPGATLATGATWSNATGAWVAAGGNSQTGQSRIVCLTSNTNNPSTANGANFRLSGGATNLPAGSRVVSAVIVGVPITEARNLSLSIDGEPLSTTTAQAATADNNGKVVYAAGATTTVYVYLAHQ